MSRKKKEVAPKQPMFKYHNCHGCGRLCNEIEASWKKIVYKVDGSAEATCKDCMKGSVGGIKDVWYGYGSGTHTEENICNPETGQPIPFWDKASKAAAMQIAGVHEAGDKYHGARSTFGGGKHN